MNYTLQELRDKDMIILEAIMGSRAYGTSLPTSDTDIRGVFIQPLEDVLKYGYVDQVSDLKNDIVFYELKRFISLIQSNNPNILELLNVPEDMIILNTIYFQDIIDDRDKFLSMTCKNSFGGYAVQQIKKSRGLNKKMNWDEKEMVRKTVLDFCYVIFSGKSFPLKSWLEDHEDPDESFKQEEFGLAKVDHARDLYAMYHLPFYKGKKGIVKDEETANDVQLVSFPKGSSFVANLVFNKDGYSSHCKLFGEYQKWLDNRNDDRFKMNKSHGKNYDSKNMMHCIRLLEMGIEIGSGKGIIVRRPNVDLLLSIRRGELDYDELMEMAESKLELMNKVFENSDLPSHINQNFMEDIQYNIRMGFYRDKNLKFFENYNKKHGK